jgi:hypothetical protein
VQSGTIRDNITFSSDRDTVDMAKVNGIMDACGLRQDISALSHGDL